MQNLIRIGTRGSNLALKQVEEVVSLLKLNNFEIKTYDTTGDMDKKTPISKIEGTNFFTDTIEQSLIENNIDCAVHSAKDMPDIIPSKLYISAITESIDKHDALVVRKGLKYKSIDELPYHAKVATCSPRRRQQLKKYRPDLQIEDIRGNIEERIEKLDNSDIDAIVISSAALIRLGLQERITQKIPFDILQPHPLQGSLAIEIRESNSELRQLFNKIDRRKKVLFVCIENSCRSQIAEAILNHFYWQNFVAYSCGSKPSGFVNPNAIKVMKQKRIDISDYKSKGFDELGDIKFDYIITMGCGDECPFYPAIKHIQWNISDPKGKSIEFFFKIVNEIEENIKMFVYNYAT